MKISTSKHIHFAWSRRSRRKTTTIAYRNIYWTQISDAVPNFLFVFWVVTKIFPFFFHILLDLYKNLNLLLHCYGFILLGHCFTVASHGINWKTVVDMCRPPIYFMGNRIEPLKVRTNRYFSQISFENHIIFKISHLSDSMRVWHKYHKFFTR